MIIDLIKRPHRPRTSIDREPRPRCHRQHAPPPSQPRRQLFQGRARQHNISVHVKAGEFRRDLITEVQCGSLRTHRRLDHCHVAAAPFSRPNAVSSVHPLHTTTTWIPGAAVAVFHASPNHARFITGWNDDRRHNRNDATGRSRSILRSAAHREHRSDVVPLRHFDAATAQLMAIVDTAVLSCVDRGSIAPATSALLVFTIRGEFAALSSQRLAADEWIATCGCGSRDHCIGRWSSLLIRPVSSRSSVVCSTNCSRSPAIKSCISTAPPPSRARASATLCRFGNCP